MTTLTPDSRAARLGPGIAIAVLSAATFATSGPLGRVLLDAGWTPGATVSVRVLGGALLLTIPALIVLRGRWGLIRRDFKTILAYATLAVVTVQFCFFNAVREIDVGIVLLIQYMAIITVAGWMWACHGQRPSRQTAMGGLLAVGGLILVLDLFSGEGSVTLTGVLWALGAMVGLAGFFVMSADNRTRLPPLVLVWAGLLLGGTVLTLAGLAGLLPWEWNTTSVEFAFVTTSWWVPAIGLVTLAAATAYWTGVVAARRLGSRLASFIGLTEVVAAVVFSWILLYQLPSWIQLAGGVLILLGIMVAKAGERESANAAQPVRTSDSRRA